MLDTLVDNGGGDSCYGHNHHHHHHQHPNRSKRLKREPLHHLNLYNEHELHHPPSMNSSYHNGHNGHTTTLTSSSSPSSSASAAAQEEWSMVRGTGVCSEKTLPHHGNHDQGHLSFTETDGHLTFNDSFTNSCDRCQHGNSTTAQSSTGGASPHPHGPLLMPSPSGSVTSVGGGSGSGGSIGVGNGVGNGGTSVSSAGPNPSSPYCVGNSGLGQNRFQYVLGAATSIATKMHEETLTYLNQGQSYEIKLKKLGDLAEFRGKLLKSIVRVCFHERRLQYMEKEQIASWKHARPGERILDIDIPLSYGICDIVQDLSMLNVCEFAWDPTKETGVFIRVNCISTEFTPKKHGGEKGVPFRIQIETYTHGEGPAQRLHSASCQVKVFKPKGADRKHKTDREKMEKRTSSDQVTCGDKFQPSYDCTVLTECLLDSIYSSPAPSVAPVTVSSSMLSQKADSIIYSPTPSEQPPGTPTSLTAESPVMGSVDTLDNTAFDFLHMYQQPLSTDASSAQTCQWLQAHRFGNYVRTFASFSGADIMRLSREDLIQICSLTDGIRLYNALHSRNIRPRLTIYVCLEPDQGSLDCVYHALYLENLSVEELIGKLAQLINVQTQNVHDVYIQGPSGIHVLVNDEVIRNLREESMFIVEVLRDQTSYRLLLKSSTVQ